MLAGNVGIFQFYLKHKGMISFFFGKKVCDGDQKFPPILLWGVVFSIFTEDKRLKLANPGITVWMIMHDIKSKTDHLSIITGNLREENPRSLFNNGSFSVL
jgi:hypothetical protein